MPGDYLYDTYYSNGIVLDGYTLVSAVPKPASFALIGGLGVLGAMIYRRRKA